MTFPTDSADYAPNARGWSTQKPRDGLDDAEEVNRGDARADALFRRVEDTVMTAASDDAEWHAVRAAIALAGSDADPACTPHPCVI